MTQFTMQICGGVMFVLAMALILVLVHISGQDEDGD